LKDFEIIKFLGAGAFGSVWLVRRKIDKELFALKIIDCSKDLKEKQKKNIENEANTYKELSGSYVVKAYWTILEGNYLFFVMDYISGGDFS